MGRRKNGAAGQWNQPSRQRGCQANLQLPAVADSRRRNAAGTCRRRSIPGHELSAGKLDSVHSRFMCPTTTAQIQLQRAAMPRILVGDSNPAEKVQPLTSLLRQGLDLTAGTDIFSARGRSPASRHSRHAVLRARALDARPGVHVAARAEANRPRGGRERPGIRSPGRQEQHRNLNQVTARAENSGSF